MKQISPVNRNRIVLISILVFCIAIALLKANQPVGNVEPIVIGIVPHHLLAERWINQFWTSIAQQQPRRIFLISPNHNPNSPVKIVTADTITDPSLDSVVIDSIAVARLRQQAGVTIDNQLVNHEHGITTHLPFLRSHLQNVTLVPLVISNYANQSDLNALIKELYAQFNRTDVIIGSIDFSHYLTADNSIQKDQQTISLINAKNTDAIFSLTNDNVDARSGLNAILLMAQALHCSQPVIYEHGNSADFSPETNNSSTSYFLLGYPRRSCFMPETNTHR